MALFNFKQRECFWFERTSGAASSGDFSVPFRLPFSWRTLSRSYVFPALPALGCLCMLQIGGFLFGTQFDMLRTLFGILCLTVSLQFFFFPPSSSLIYIRVAIRVSLQLVYVVSTEQVGQSRVPCENPTVLCRP